MNLSLKKRQILEDIKRCGLAKKCICLHSSFKSFGETEGGPETVVEAFLESGCTLIVPTFSFSYIMHPPDNMKPKRNGVNYSNMSWLTQGQNNNYNNKQDVLDTFEMGVISKTLLEKNGRIRGKHPLCSFSGAGPYASEIIKTQQTMDVMAPIRELALFEGVILLAGVGVNKMTALHLSEQMAGRSLFLRWAKDSDGLTQYAETAGCSDGFSNLDPYINHLDKKEKCGESNWRIFPVGKLLKQAARVIQLKPETTHCKNADCLRCNDAIAGGPVL